MKQKLWRIMSCVLTVCLLAVSLNYLTKLMEHKRSIEKYQPFFEQEADFDVLLLGTSHTKHSIFPMELWKDYGIVSYNMGINAAAIPTVYWILENALEYTNPKLLVVDCLNLENPWKVSYRAIASHAFDAFPLSKTKIATAMDLADTNNVSGAEENIIPIGILWNFSQHHSRWSELKAADFSPNITKEKGAESLIAVATPKDTSQVDHSGKLEDNIGTEYLRKIIEDSQARGIEVLLTYLPFPERDIDWANANKVYDIAAEYGINFINFLDMDIVDYDTDCYDAVSHLNPSGARKVTDYLGNYIMEHYEIPDQRSNIEYSKWFEDYEEYKTMKAENLRAQKNWDTYLMLLADKNMDTVIEIGDPGLWNDTKFVNLVKNLGIDTEDIPENTNFCMIRRGGSQTEAIAVDTASDLQKETALGMLCISHDASGKYSVSIDGAACFSQDKSDTWNLRVYARDSETLDTVGHSTF